MEYKYKTLAQAQKDYSDAIQVKLSHLPYCMTKAMLTDIGENNLFTEKAKVLFVKVGKGVSTVIASRQAQEEQKNGKNRVI